MFTAWWTHNQGLWRTGWKPSCLRPRPGDTRYRLRTGCCVWFHSCFIYAVPRCRVPKVTDLQAHNVSPRRALWACRTAISGARHRLTTKYTLPNQALEFMFPYPITFMNTQDPDSCFSPMRNLTIDMWAVLIYISKDVNIEGSEYNSHTKTLQYLPIISSHFHCIVASQVYSR